MKYFQNMNFCCSKKISACFKKPRCSVRIDSKKAEVNVHRLSGFLALNITALLLSGCSLSWFGFGSDSETSNKSSDRDLCSSKTQIVANHSYYESWQACERLTAKGDYNAEYVLGLIYTDEKLLKGFIEPENRFARGIGHIKNAADHSVPQAQRAIGEYYEKNGSTEQAREYLGKAAAAGDTDAMISLATGYETEGSCSKAVPYYEKEISAKKNAAEGWIYLYLLTYTGCKDMKPDPLLSCGYYHNVLNSTAKNTVLSLIDFEKSSKTAGKKGSITLTTGAVQNYYKGNTEACKTKGLEIKERLFTD